MTKNGELRDFLRTRRARLRPEDVGIRAAGRRRVPGLRREEVAMLAGVSLDYYTRLEQGRRNLQPSGQVLDAIARALRLTEVERLYLHNLARSATVAPEPERPRLAPLDAGTRLMLDGLGIPAVVVDVRGDVHAANRLGRALLPGLEPGANHARWLFLDPATRALLPDWEMTARLSVAVLREAAARYPRDRRLYTLIGELSVASPEFRTWWAEHEVDTRCRGPKWFRHPLVGELTLHVEALQLQDGERWLYAYSAEPGSPSAEALRLLGTWAATEDTAPKQRPVSRTAAS